MASATPDPRDITEWEDAMAREVQAAEDAGHLMDPDEEAVRHPLPDPTQPKCWRDVVATYNEGDE